MSGMGERRSEPARAVGVVALAMVAAALAAAQTASGSRAQAIVSSGGLYSDSSSLAGQGQGQLYREIDDPHNGDRWLLLRNDETPGGPGRLVRVAAQRPATATAALSPGVPASARPAGAAEAPLLPVIHAGDRLVVEEHTAVVDAALEARALMPAVAGAAFEARLAIGGRVVRVVALGAGRAALAETEARP